jgi:hypothetical protein
MVASKAPEPEAAGRDWNTVIAYGALVVGVALTMLAGVAVLVLWRGDK